MCGAKRDVWFVPIADIRPLFITSSARSRSDRVNQVGLVCERFFTPRLRFKNLDELNACLLDQCITYVKAHRHSPSSSFLGQPADFSRLVSIGRMRIRLDVAAKIAFVTAGATTAVGASPKPPGASELLTRCVSTTGASSIRSGR